MGEWLRDFDFFSMFSIELSSLTIYETVHHLSQPS